MINTPAQITPWVFPVDSAGGGRRAGSIGVGGIAGTGLDAATVPYALPVSGGMTGDAEDFQGRPEARKTSSLSAWSVREDLRSEGGASTR